MRAWLATIAAITMATGCGKVVTEPDATTTAIDAPAVVDAPVIDGAEPIDASPIDASSVDARPTDAAGTMCVPVDDGRECTQDVCQNDVPTHVNRASGTFCNGLANQCDGLGNCVDCVNSGGCEECCVCNSNQMCVPF